ncbi:MAG: hypothetical protein H0X66_17885 [Verrucomicrobia bacterium]|nr:hypothetical protein [Verrucomicrobiota bacterium]
MQTFDWNFVHLTNQYFTVGQTNIAWDAPVIHAFSNLAIIRATRGATNIWWERFGQHSSKAVASGCDDPLLANLHLENEHGGSRRKGRTNIAISFKESADTLGQSSYHPLWKLRGYTTAAYAMVKADRAQYKELIIAYRHLAAEQLASVLQDTAIPFDEANHATYGLLHGSNDSVGPVAELYLIVEDPLTNWNGTSLPHLAKGKASINLAWQARGMRYADFTEEGWVGFKSHLLEAETALETAWELNTNDFRIPYEMMMVELGQGKGRERMELWFERTIRISSYHYGAYIRKLNYLEPKWHGSFEEMIKFAREAMYVTNADAKVMLLPVTAVEDILQYVPVEKRAEFWLRSGLFKDIQPAYERFLKRYPDASGWRHKYAVYAYKCQQWKVLKQQLDLIPKIDPEALGGAEEYRKMQKALLLHTTKRP